MINPFHDVNWNPNTADRRKFGISYIIGFPCLALVWLLIGRLTKGSWPLETALWIAGIGAALGVIFFLIPAIVRPFYVVWYFLACCIGFVVANVLFSLFYYLLVTPIGFVARVVGRDPLAKRIRKDAPTYWQPVERVNEPNRYFKQF